MVKGQVPETQAAGTYHALFGGIEEDEGEYGIFWKWTFHVYLADGGTNAVGDISSDNFGPRSKANKWTAGMLGRPIAPGEVVEFDELKGTPCVVDVIIDPASGYNKIDNVRPAPAQQQPAAPAAAPAAPVASAPVAPVAPAPVPAPAPAAPPVAPVAPVPAPPADAPVPYPPAPAGTPVTGEAWVPPDEAPF
jgi:hypothetical protein